MFKKKLKLLVQENQGLGEESFQILSDQHAFALSGGSGCRNLESCGTYCGSCRRLSSCGTYSSSCGGGKEIEA